MINIIQKDIFKDFFELNVSSTKVLYIIKKRVRFVFPSEITKNC